MCGRFVNINKIKKIKKIFDISDSNELNENISYNVAPSHKLNIIIKKNNFSINESSWGINFINKQSNENINMINSRIETLSKNIYFNNSSIKNRCLIPANGFFEWQLKNNNKTPFFFQIPVLELFFFAGIWKIDLNKNISFSIITKKANNFLFEIHHRMPIILDLNNAINYLNYELNYEDLKKDLDIENDLDYYPVSKFVNSPINNTNECIKSLN